METKLSEEVNRNGRKWSLVLRKNVSFCDLRSVWGLGKCKQMSNVFMWEMHTCAHESLLRSSGSLISPCENGANETKCLENSGSHMCAYMLRCMRLWTRISHIVNGECISLSVWLCERACAWKEEQKQKLLIKGWKPWELLVNAGVPCNVSVCLFLFRFVSSNFFFWLVAIQYYRFFCMEKYCYPRTWIIISMILCIEFSCIRKK